ncbi:hypothetical protein [Rhodococcus sp. Q]|uniref:hypothetical protein n=1 Tax=Rhodococcus sp. Q TaxID=2502252 RepID=UPI0010F896E0|nr:hypothetical protein [Rhodococcus sp. Q]
MPARTLPVTPRTAVSALAGLLGAFLVAFVLTDPPGGRWAIEVSDRELDRWLGAQPTGIVVGVVVAVAVCIALQRSGSRRLAWVVAAAATLPIGLVRMAVPEITGVDALISLHIVKCVAAGALLGAAVAAVWGHRGAQLAVVGGAVTGFLSVPAFGAATSTQSTSTLGEPSWWLLAVTVAAAIAAAAVADTGSRIPKITAPEAGAALLTIAALAVINRAQLAWIGQSGNETRTRQWVIIAVAMVVILVATVVCARFIARRTEIAGGVIVVAATGIAAAAMPVLVDLRSPFRDVPAWLTVTVAAVAVLAGMVLALRLPNPMAGLGVAALVPVVAVIWPDFGADGPWLLVRLAVVGVGAGWAVAGTLPGSAAVAAAALSIPFVSYVFHAAATVIAPSGPVTYDGAFQPLSGSEMSLEYASELDKQFERFALIPHYDDRVAGIALALAVAFCAWGIHGLRARR